MWKRGSPLKKRKLHVLVGISPKAKRTVYFKGKEFGLPYVLLNYENNILNKTKIGEEIEDEGRT